MNKPKNVQAAWLTTIILLAIVVRLAFAQTEGSQGWGILVIANGSLAHNIREGTGFFYTLSQEMHDASSTPHRVLDWSEVLALPEGAPARPIAYLLPGYPYTLAAVWSLAAHESYWIAQAVQAVLDGVIGCLGVYALLAASRRPRAGLIGAAGYALAPPLIVQSVLVLPDSLSSALNLLALASVAVGFARNHIFAGAAVAGLILGSASWIRGDFLALLPLLPPAVLALSRPALRVRLAWGGSFLAAAALPMVLLGLFYQQVYGEFHLTRPGVGILLWESILQQPNPWGLEARPGGDLDLAAIALVEKKQLAYGYWESDAFLFAEAVGHFKDRPTWFVGPTLQRLLRVISLQRPPHVQTSLPSVTQSAMSIVGPFLPVVAAFGVYLIRKDEMLRNLLLAAWFSRVLPFSVIRDELRFEILIVAVYVVCLAVVVDWLWLWAEARLRSRILARALPES